MPTGYTAALYDGKDQSFEDFVLTCARAMGACINQRDDPVSERPTLSSPSKYYADAVIEAQAELDRIRKMSFQEAATVAEAERLKAIQDRDEHNQKVGRRRERYSLMLERVKAWEPPSREHRGFQDFMVNQLTMSLESDCFEYFWNVPHQMTGEDWLRKKMEEAARDLANAISEHNKEIERTKDRNKWIVQLYHSLGLTPPEE